ncbi:Bacterial-like globin [Seminavis robusta]|uniref:Bacterial-like globin n=1 Tax=Seminavis robusta TaxID=568900 RepID=A0A9N8EPY9_9STRA|nr:Bacterial-like globin [Seminavis robusta]|eukprot:Sro1407_g269980.1 Bacterial-like globin (324) ;mRNA; f:1733-2704
MPRGAIGRVLSSVVARTSFSNGNGTLATVPSWRRLSSASLLPFSVLKRIQSDLNEADVNGDGKIDFEELKLILSKYPHSFSHSQVEQIGELFFVGRSGQAVRHTTFLRGIQHVLLHQQSQEEERVEISTNQSSIQEKDVSPENPLQLESLDDNRCWVSPQEASSSQETLYDIQTQFDQSLLAYVREVQLMEQLGGTEALQRMSDDFYHRVASDPRLQHFFVGHDMDRLKRHPYNFMRVAFDTTVWPEDDPQVFASRVRRAHGTLKREQGGLTTDHFDAMMDHFVGTLTDDGTVAQDTIDTAVEVLHLFRDCFAPSYLPISDED